MLAAAILPAISGVPFINRLYLWSASFASFPSLHFFSYSNAFFVYMRIHACDFLLSIYFGFCFAYPFFNLSHSRRFFLSVLNFSSCLDQFFSTFTPKRLLGTAICHSFGEFMLFLSVLLVGIFRWKSKRFGFFIFCYDSRWCKNCLLLALKWVLHLCETVKQYLHLYVFVYSAYILDLWQWHKMCSTSPRNIGELTPIDTHTQCTYHNLLNFIPFWFEPCYGLAKTISYLRAYRIFTVDRLCFRCCWEMVILATKTTTTTHKRRSEICNMHNVLEHISI